MEREERKEERGEGRMKGRKDEEFKCSLQKTGLSWWPAMRETWVRSLGWEDPLEKGMATHSSILAWRIPWTV